MGKKYLLEIEENKDGSFAWSNFAPYTAPDLEKIRKEAYEQGLNDAREGKASCQFCEYEMCSDRFDPCRICACNYTNFFEPKKQEKEEIIDPDKNKVEALANDIGIHKLYALVKEIRGE